MSEAGAANGNGLEEALAEGLTTEEEAARGMEKSAEFTSMGYFGAPEGTDLGISEGKVGEGPGLPERVPAPRAWEGEKATEIPVPGTKEEAKARKRRRRSILGEEEGGLLSTAPAYRRTILGG